MYTREERLDRRRHSKLGGSRGMLPQKMFHIWWLRNTKQCERFIKHPDLMTTMLSRNKKMYIFPDFSCMHGRMCEYGRQAPGL